MQYRREIDGLRAIAVLPVILFHAGFGIFSGGYIGVDVFFVISGHLITSILIAELNKETFSIVHFYERRARRILPALFVVMLACLPFAYMWMLPSQMEEFAQSVVAVSLFLSNWLFWSQSGYFETATELKPLLHTWSLAVEEQYYLLFPILMMAIWRLGLRFVGVIFVALASSSLLLSEWGWRNEPDINFFFTFSRFWELLVGSICAYLTVGQPTKSSNVLSSIGLAAIVFAIFAFDGETPFPSVYALIPVVGTALIILYARQGTWVAKLLSMRAFVGIGLISYSAYLWHQPLFAFGRLRSDAEPGHLLMGLLAVVALLLAWATWRFVEQPFRRNPRPLLATRWRLFATGGAFGAAFVAVGLVGFLSGGNILNRYDQRIVDLIAEMHDGNYTWQNKKDLRFRQFDDNGKENILVIGDSNSGDLLNALVFGFNEEFNFSSVTVKVGCGNLYLDRDVFAHHETVRPATECLSSDRFDADTIALIESADYVFLASSWRAFEAEYFSESWDRLQQDFGEKFYVFGAKNISFSERQLYDEGFDDLFDLSVPPHGEKNDINQLLKEVAGQRFIDPSDIFCLDGACRIFADGNALFYDGSHVTRTGVAHLANWLQAWMLGVGLGDRKV
ncbi:acyltransferase family protein [Loktanella sp. Alg231-35]|uniref:acyltransferase family protein n=1 Tax=Loktanella sp. Alg231-35 TaxID=1922220 RepID=UPI000D55B140|nr:acyltransferase family protein [Loktanella sp. Alg231-35]